jgi:hypothetical protein
MVRKQKEELLRELNDYQYRNFRFSREKMEEIMKKHRERFEDENGPIFSR